MTGFPVQPYGIAAHPADRFGAAVPPAYTRVPAVPAILPLPPLAANPANPVLDTNSRCSARTSTIIIIETFFNAVVEFDLCINFFNNQ
jgi:hypothetical protein